MQKRAKIGTAVAGMIAALAVAGAVAPAAHAADGAQQRCYANLTANATEQHTRAHELVRVVQEPQPDPREIEMAQAHLTMLRAVGAMMREFANQGYWEECARVR
ncbi:MULTISPECIES: hypothetical protein [unclassified Streptomyces]|uniref:hypothetical protein n=1 Tax=unclassified Streptomyces TaxID=2593676 RepID=UPI00340EF3FA|nr:hypothetical protein OG254_40550 [Streptomyces sp. NBC_01092]